MGHAICYGDEDVPFGRVLLEQLIRNTFLNGIEKRTDDGEAVIPWGRHALVAAAVLGVFVGLSADMNGQVSSGGWGAAGMLIALYGISHVLFWALYASLATWSGERAVAGLALGGAGALLIFDLAGARPGDSASLSTIILLSLAIFSAERVVVSVFKRAT